MTSAPSPSCRSIAPESPPSIFLAQHPRQTAPDIHAFTGGDADLSFLVKTKLMLSLAANVPLAALHLNSQSPLPTRPISTASIQRIFPSNGRSRAPPNSTSNSSPRDSALISLPVPISIGLKVDQPPRITMAYSGVRPRITARAKIPLTIDARDDFGILSADLAIKDESPDPGDPAKLIPHDSAQPLFPDPAAAPIKPDPTPKPCSNSNKRSTSPRSS